MGIIGLERIRFLIPKTCALQKFNFWLANLFFRGQCVEDAFKKAWDWILNCTRNPNIFQVGTPLVGQEVAYKHRVRSSKKEHIVKFRMRNENEVITAIGVFPMNLDEDRSIFCPETEITDGGVNHRNVELRLTKHLTSSMSQWECDVFICGC